MGEVTRPAEQSASALTAERISRAGHPFYARAEVALAAASFDEIVAGVCGPVGSSLDRSGAMSVDRYFRLLMVGYFEAIESARGIIWRAGDSLAVRSFLRLADGDFLPTATSMEQMRQLISAEAHCIVFASVWPHLVDAVSHNSLHALAGDQTLEAQAALRSIVRWDAREGFEDYLRHMGCTPSGSERRVLGASDRAQCRSATDLKTPQSMVHRWAAFVVRAATCGGDVTTIGGWAKLVGASYTSVCETCRLVGTKPQHARNFARALFAVLEAAGRDCPPAVLLNISDVRTLRVFLSIAGAGFLAVPDSSSLDGFLCGQRFIQGQHEGVKLVRALLVDRLERPVLGLPSN